MAESNPRNSKIENPNFFDRKPLISHISAKKKFGKICKAKLPAIENMGDFRRPESPNRVRPRHPRILQGFGPLAAKGAWRRHEPRGIASG